MWIKTAVLLCCFLAACLAVDEHRPKLKEDSRGKRNLQYTISHHYTPFNNYRGERRISTGPHQIPLHHNSPFFPGPRSPAYPKGRPHSLPAPPYAVQMEPLIHYSQRDPLYDTNTLSLNADAQNADDLLTDNNHLNEQVYGPPKHIVERPVYIKEPEPIIEIIIKESNVTLPPPPAPPSPPPRKKEQVQVFYVKYKKNPHGQGKDSIIYEKPVPAISPVVPDEHEEEPVEHYHQEVVTSAPVPSTTLRTIIRPESETYHSPSGVKVTFGKEGFDYDKRSNKPEDQKASGDQQQTVQFPQGRQLSIFPQFPARRPSSPSFKQPPPPGFRQEPSRQPQNYRPFNQPPPNFRPAPQFPRPNPVQHYSTLPKYLTQQPVSQQFPRPAPPQFHQQPQQRQPVPYQPFESLRTPQQPQVQPFRTQTHFPIVQQLPNQQKPNGFTQNQQQGVPNHNPQVHFQRPQFQEQEFIQRIPQGPKEQSQSPFSQGVHKPEQQQEQFVQRLPQPTKEQQFIQQPQQQFIQQHQQQSVQQPPQQFLQQQQFVQQSQQQFAQPQQLSQHSNFAQIPQIQNILPPGGELIQSLPKFEQHISVVEPNQQHFSQQFLTHQQQVPQQEPQKQVPSNHLTQAEFNQKIQEQIRQANALQESIRQQSVQQSQYLEQQQGNQASQTFDFYQSTARPSYSSSPKRNQVSSTTPAPSTTTESSTPSTTTKDPKVLEAQLPDEVPEELRQQLLSSGILNHADISILDYDKVGDIPLSALPPDQLANFYNAGGAQQLSGSAPIPSVVKPDGSAVETDQETSASEIEEVRDEDVRMKVVHYDPQSERGQQVQESYVKSDATKVEPVVLNDQRYNRYLPLKISGSQFPIPDVAELRGKKVSSVVVLAPITYDFSPDNADKAERKVRSANSKDVGLIQADHLKVLLDNPSRENFQDFLERENKTESDRQAVILLVTGPDVNGAKEIYMYDVSTKTVSKLNGELSTAFVEAAEANAKENKEGQLMTATNIIETRVPYESDSSEIVQTRIAFRDSFSAQPSENYVHLSGSPITVGDS